ncbi:MAG: ferrous iron transport protein A [Sphaerochaetaceae bacterium]|jgi:ferrous iron transport protein A
MNKTLALLPIGNSGVVEGVNAPKALKRRLMDMGFTRGIPVKVVKVAPLGDPLEVEIRGYNLCLRKEEAKIITLRQE